MNIRLEQWLSFTVTWSLRKSRRRRWLSWERARISLAWWELGSHCLLSGTLHWLFYCAEGMSYWLSSWPGGMMPSHSALNLHQATWRGRVTQLGTGLRIGIICIWCMRFLVKAHLHSILDCLCRVQCRPDIELGKSDESYFRMSYFKS